MQFNNQPDPVKNDSPHSWKLVVDDFTRGRVNASALSELYFQVTSVVMQVTALRRMQNGTWNLEDKTEDEINDELRAEVIRLAEGRDAFGAAKYGTHLQPFNGRNSIDDALEEALDLLVYLRTFIFEKEGS